jgi:hypothetical protein
MGDDASRQICQGKERMGIEESCGYWVQEKKPILVDEDRRGEGRGCGKGA